MVQTFEIENRKSRRGFTLVEMIVVLAIAFIVTAVSIVSWAAYDRDMKRVTTNTDGTNIRSKLFNAIDDSMSGNEYITSSVPVPLVAVNHGVYGSIRRLPEGIGFYSDVSGADSAVTTVDWIGFSNAFNNLVTDGRYVLTNGNAAADRSNSLNSIYSLTASSSSIRSTVISYTLSYTYVPSGWWGSYVVTESKISFATNTYTTFVSTLSDSSMPTGYISALQTSGLFSGSTTLSVVTAFKYTSFSTGLTSEWVSLSTSLTSTSSSAS